MHKDALTLDDLISLFSILGALLSIIMLIGVAGAAYCDSITLVEATKKSIIWIVILICCVIGIMHEERKEEEGKYDRL